MGSDGRNEGSSEKWWRITPAGSNGTECSIKYRGWELGWEEVFTVDLNSAQVTRAHVSFMCCTLRFVYYTSIHLGASLGWFWWTKGDWLAQAQATGTGTGNGTLSPVLESASFLVMR